MSTAPLVSVAVITYNMAAYLPQLLDSILAQQVSFDYEIVVGEDCSPDSSRAILEGYAQRYPGRFNLLPRPNNLGGSRNMADVFLNCEGKYIAILEGDDFWGDSRKLQAQVDFLEAHPEYIGTSCNSWCEQDPPAAVKRPMRSRAEPKDFDIRDYMARSFHGRLPSSTDTWVFRNVFKENQADTRLMVKAHPMVWDQSLILILYGLGKVYYEPAIRSHHRSVVRPDGTNYQSLIARENRLHGDSLMYQAHEEYMAEVLGIKPGRFRLVRGDVFVDAFFCALLSRKKQDWEVARRVWRDQRRKGMLLKLCVVKSFDITVRKLKKILGFGG